MNWNEYLDLSEVTLSTQFHCEKRDELLLHSLVGILTEVEELLDNHTEEESDETNRGEETGDIWWYMAILGREYDIYVTTEPGYEIDSSIEDPMVVVLQIIKKTLKMLDFMKKKLYYNKPINDVLMKQYANDLVSLLLIYSKLFNINTSESFDINIAKLKARYGEKFSSERAINRDLDLERTILEGKSNG